MRSPGWRQVLGIATLILLGVVGVALTTRSVPGLEDLFLRTPFTIVVLASGTLVVLVLVARGGRPPG